MPTIHSNSEEGRTPPPSAKSGLSDNSVAAVAYISPLPAFFFLAIHRYNKRPYVRFHSWQSLLFHAFVFLFFLAFDYVLQYAGFLGPRVLLGLWVAAVLVAFLIWLWCFAAALNGNRFKLPLIGEWADEQAYR